MQHVLHFEISKAKTRKKGVQILEGRTAPALVHQVMHLEVSECNSH